MSVYIWINYGIWDSFVVGQDTNTAKWSYIYIYYTILCVESISNHSRYNYIIRTACLSIFPCTGHPVLHHMKISFQLTNQRNKLLEKGKIVHKVLELNMVVFIHVPCCSYFFLKTDIGANKMNPQYRVLPCLSS